MIVLGVDIGGSGIKGAPVDLETGETTAERYRLETPRPASPDNMIPVLAKVIAYCGGSGPVGVTFPGVVSGGVTHTAANLDKGWIGLNVEELFGKESGRPCTVLNDADAAGIAEMAFGAGRGQKGVVLMLTFGTGIGSALFVDGRLVPNTELGHLELRGKEAEHRASDRAREEGEMSWGKWAGRVEDYLAHVEKLFSPNLFIIGGGVSRKAEKFLPYVDIRTPMVAAALLNNAGIVGAAMAANAAHNG